MHRYDLSRGSVRLQHAWPVPPNPESDDDRDDGEAPETPTDEPMPIPVLDPPSDDRPRPPMTVARL